MSVALSQLPQVIVWPATVLTLLLGVRTAWRYQHLPRIPLVLNIDAAVISLNDWPINQLHLQWRWHWLFLRWQDATRRTQRLVFWPDNLTSAQRRALRLLVQQ